jgi:hypothetical protein
MRRLSTLADILNDFAQRLDGVLRVAPDFGFVMYPAQRHAAVLFHDPALWQSTGQ